MAQRLGLLPAEVAPAALPDLPFRVRARALSGTPIVEIQVESADRTLAFRAAETLTAVLVEGTRQRQAQRFAAVRERLEEQIASLQAEVATLRARPGLLVVEHRLGFVCANAGIDHSNVCVGNEGDAWALLLPEDPDASAERIRQGLAARAGVAVAVLIIDSHGRAWRQGTVGVTIGVAGMNPISDLRGQRDRYGRTLRITEVGTADEIAAGASLLMGQAAEGTPVVIVRGASYQAGEGNLRQILRPRELDLFR